jgi:hypothetical protein
VVALRDGDVDAIAGTLAQTAGVLPAAVAYHAQAARTPAEFVRAILDDLEADAIGLFPAWLPGAEHVQAPGGAGLAAVRAMATDRAAHSAHFSPFLSDLAALALSGAHSTRGRFTPEIRAAGLVRVIADGLGRQHMVLLVDLPDRLSDDHERALVAGCEWLASCARIGIWLTGARLRTVDWLASATLSQTAPPAGARSGPVAAVPGVVGTPHPRSAAEALLEAALVVRPWAVGRMWNQSYQSHPLRAPVRLDLLWPAERCVVEIDGPEHCHPVQFETDRRRDVQLQLDGYAVLRFTNARIRHDVETVVNQIGTFIQARRRESSERTT